MDSDNEDGPAGGYNDSNRAFLQALMARGCIGLADGRKLLAEILSVQEGQKVSVDQVSEAKFSVYIAQANDAISPFDYEIKATLHQRTKVRYWAIVNSTSDPLTRIATTHTAEEIGFIRRMLDALFETHNSQRREIMAVTSMQATARTILKPSNARESGGEPADKGLTGSEAERCLETLIKEGWFEKSKAHFYTLSPRALMELRSYLVETYNDPDLEPDEWQPIKMCEACKDIVTTGQRCSNLECNVRLHDICDAFWNSRRDKNCPKCKTPWDGSGLVGQKVVQAMEERLNGKRKGGGARQKANEEVEEDAEEESGENGEVDGEADSNAAGDDE